MLSSLRSEAKDRKDFSPDPSLRSTGEKLWPGLSYVFLLRSLTMNREMVYGHWLIPDIPIPLGSWVSTGIGSPHKNYMSEVRQEQFLP